MTANKPPRPFASFAIEIVPAGTEIEVLDPTPQTVIIIDGEPVFQGRTVYITTRTYDAAIDEWERARKAATILTKSWDIEDK